MQQMGLATTSHSKSYPLGWVLKDAENNTQQCSFKFDITLRHVDEVTSEVVPLDVRQIILGSPTSRIEMTSSIEDNANIIS